MASGFIPARLLRGLLTVSLLASVATSVGAIPRADPWEFWRPAADSRQVDVDHSAWDRLLRDYLDTAYPDGIHRFGYAAVSPPDRRLLDDYIASLAGLSVADLTRAQQQAYWINLYNALTVRLILDNPGVTSIRKIKDGLFSVGPWNRDVVVVNGKALTLNDIEHRILRPLYRDPRVHFAVNCASLGCPNLAAQAYTADNLEALYESGARAFVNHSRGVTRQGRQLRLSSIFDWFAEDFGEDRQALLNWLSRYAEPELADTLRSWRGPVRYDYDWTLNAVRNARARVTRG
jgi:hypothetical protein